MTPWLGRHLWNIWVPNDHGHVPLVVRTSFSFPHSWLITEFVTRCTRHGAGSAYPSEDPEFTPVFCGVGVTRSLVLYVCVVDRCLYFFFWPSCCRLLRFTDSDYPFGIFKLFLTSFSIIIPVVLYSILSVLVYCFIDSRFRAMCFWYKYFYNL